MAQNSSPRRVGPVVASAVVGVVLGVVGIVGVSIFSGQNTVPQSGAVSPEDAVLGSPEYGTRQ